MNQEAKDFIQNKMDLRIDNKNKPIDSPSKSSLLAETSITHDLVDSAISVVWPLDDLTIWKRGFQEQSASATGEEHSSLFQGWNAQFLGSTEISIGQDSPIQFNPSELNITQISTVQNSPRKISIGQVSAIQGGASQISTSQVSAGQVGIRQNCPSQIDTSQIGVTQIGTHQPSIFKIDTDQVSPFQVGILQKNICQISFSQTSSSQISSPQLGFTQISSNQVSSFQVNPTKISLPSSISLEQLLSSYPHLYTSAINSGMNYIWILVTLTSLKFTKFPIALGAELDLILYLRVLSLTYQHLSRKHPIGNIKLK
ncbi:hypothetical protein A6769_12185 [Nostoc punctiforme NIES-2108]|uniref:Uncharacterized protein n=1 Tax=Nostoc punctiforme NIES-2108 TaxID=1356359 RepID=A0A367RPN7_NOSPU|nr:hypothetical protein A6769_12185 [Nostoc punctiforme NIES-2108]